MEKRKEGKTEKRKLTKKQKKAAYKATNKFIKATYKRYRLDLRYDKDQALIQRMDAQKSKNQYLKDLIKKDLEETRIEEKIKKFLY